MKTFFFLLFFVPLCAHCQEQKLLTFAGGAFVDKQIMEPGIGIKVSASAPITNSLYIGLSAGALHFNYLQNVYLPFSAKLTLLPFQFHYIIVLIAYAELGYGIYKENGIAGRTRRFNKGGGLTYTAGIGGILAIPGRIKLFGTAGFATFNTITTWHNTHNDFESFSEKKYIDRKIEAEAGIIYVLE